MKLAGYMHDIENLDEYDSRVTDAVITNSKISFDWDEDEGFHATMQSSDGGITYHGTFGSPTPEAGCVIEGTRFQAKNGEILLWLRWYREDTGNEGSCIVHLADSWED